jgi:uncharacterized membrane protein YcaP (DUF421 family)
VDVLLHSLEIVGRVTAIYVAAMILLRLSGRRELAELGPMDLLTMLLVSETVSPALTGGDDSVPTGLLAAATLMGLGVLTSLLALHSKKAERLIVGDSVILIENGKLRPDVLRKFRITDEDLRAKLHEHGVLRVDEVLRAYVEADGEISMIPRARGDRSERE